MPPDFEIPVGQRAKGVGLPIVSSDGRFSASEQTKTFGFDDTGVTKFFLIPTIVVGRDGILEKVDDETAVRMFRNGLNGSVGGRSFDSIKEAGEFAGKRSKAGGRFSNLQFDSPQKDK